MKSFDYNTIQLSITASGNSSATASYYFDGLRGSELKDRVVTNLEGEVSNSTLFVYPNPSPSNNLD